MSVEILAISNAKALHPVLVPANTDERAVAESVLGDFRGCDFYGDKGFIGQDWQEEIKRWTGNRI